jgi:general secretion pathway protein H
MTSATGISIKRINHPLICTRPPAGFTLLELMVVLVIIGVIFSFAVLSMGGDKYVEAMEREARRLATVVDMASDEAVLLGEEVAIRFFDDGYEFLILQNNIWLASGDGNLMKMHSLPDGIGLQLEVENDLPVFPGDEKDEAIEDADQDSPPQVYLLSSGEVTPFSVTFRAEQSDVRYHLKVSVMGETSWEQERAF